MNFKRHACSISILATLLFLFMPLLPLSSFRTVVHASGDVPVSEAQAEYSVITGFENMEYLTNLPTLELVKRSSQFTNDLVKYAFSLYNINAYVERPDGSTETITLKVIWDCFGNNVFNVDTTTPGSYTEFGYIQLPDEHTVFGPGVPSTLTIPVNVYIPDSPVKITYIRELDMDFIFYFSYALEQHHDISEVTTRIRPTWICEDANGYEYECPVLLDTSQVDIDTPGLYEIAGTFKPPAHCEFAKELVVPTFSITVTVQAPGKPRLDCMQLSGSLLYFPWIATGLDIDGMTIKLSENDGEWRTLTHYEEVYILESELTLDTCFLTEGSSYRLQAFYEGGQTGIAFFDYNEGLFKFKEYVDGDRDGGDTGGNPPVATTATTTDSTSTSAATATTDTSSPTATTATANANLGATDMPGTETWPYVTLIVLVILLLILFTLLLLRRKK